jgi:hypothetical protein
MDAAFTQWPQRATVYGCPLSDCKWAHAEPHPTAYDGEGATIEECVTNALTAHLAEVESVVKAHLETHSLLEWVTEVMRLREQAATPAATSIDRVYVLADSDPYGFANFTIPRVFADAEVAKETAAEHIGPDAEWVPFGPTLSSLMLRSDGKLTGLTIRRVRVER